MASKSTISSSTESQASASLTVGSGPKAEGGRKRTSSTGLEDAYLSYSETDAEYDLMRIFRLFAGDHVVNIRSGYFGLRKQTSVTKFHPIIVLDEVDKLTTLKSGDNGGSDALESLLGSLKNLLTADGPHFILVGGVDLLDRVNQESQRGIGVFETIFGFRMYVPCVWNPQISSLLGNPPASSPWAIPNNLQSYLEYRCRGIARKYWQEVNQLITWRDGVPYFYSPQRSRSTIDFFASLLAKLRRFMDRYERRNFEDLDALEYDRRQLSILYFMDCVLETRGSPFTASDILASEDGVSFDDVLRISKLFALEFLSYLTDQRILRVVRQPSSSTVTAYGDIRRREESVFVLQDWVRYQLRDIGVALTAPGTKHVEEQSAEPQPDHKVPPVLSPSSTRNSPSPGYPSQTPHLAEVSLPPIKILDGKYQLRRVIGQGGMGTVYLGSDLDTDDDVAIKMLPQWVTDDPLAVARLRREAAMLERVRHPNVVQILHFSDDGESPYLVMEYINGDTLRQASERRNGFSVDEGLDLFLQILEGVQACAAADVHRLDLKPSNIIVREESLNPVIIDLGIAKPLKDSQITDIGTVIGTLPYMAPESVMDEGVRPESEVFCAGILFYEILTGEQARPPASSAFLMVNKLMQPLTLERLHLIPEPIRPALVRATQLDYETRFHSAQEFAAALRAARDSLTADDASLRIARLDRGRSSTPDTERLATTQLSPSTSRQAGSQTPPLHSDPHDSE
ncbi:serine/threonine-protein kinase [Gordonia sp. N1V]|uniref:serine/threonine protein kinase n=1 Tax=Gordonia sp. N1V TaxID=3034163 RepID=UPI0023E25109|nr:serine/threonine-protein kinase [Gordonia sp. N1V]MDF3285148.1 serine/threonine-protein kinase [Gordonia sp. N1V]